MRGALGAEGACRCGMAVWRPHVRGAMSMRAWKGRVGRAVEAGCMNKQVTSPFSLEAQRGVVTRGRVRWVMRDGE